MRQAFRSKTSEAYGYAVVDVVNTLLVFEQMQHRDRHIYESFGFGDGEVPDLRSTLGSRVSDFLFRTVCSAAIGSQNLPTKNSVRELMRRSGADFSQATIRQAGLAIKLASVHGGLLYSRSPTRFFHEASGMLRDIDMAGCYNNIIGGISGYYGRPIVFEPGGNGITLKEAVELIAEHADSDAWQAFVTGDMCGQINSLIPSTEDAVTSSNYRSRRRRLRDMRIGFAGDLDEPQSEAVDRGSRLYSARIEFGIVTWATWQVIQSLPVPLRTAYENLRVESICFFPHRLIAHDGQEFDRIVAEFGAEQVPWRSVLDMDQLKVKTDETIDAEYVCLQYAIGEYARRIGKFRRDAQREAR